MQEVSGRINEKGVYSYDLLSKWNINKEKGLKTDFEKEAFNYLFDKKGTVFSRFMVHNGVYSLRYATADVGSAAGCVNCHNNHEESPKKDFKLGDVMGVLVVNIPIGTMSAETAAFFAKSNDDDFGKDTFLKTKEVFETTLAALMNGGKAPLDLGMTKFTVLPNTASPAIKSKLNEVKKLWDSTQDGLNKLTDTEPNSAEYIVAYNNAYKSNNATMKAMNEAVALYVAVATKRGEYNVVDPGLFGRCGMSGHRPWLGPLCTPTYKFTEGIGCEAGRRIQHRLQWHRSRYLPQARTLRRVLQSRHLRWKKHRLLWKRCQL